MTPPLLVLDFDGVVCDGMAEFVESSWRTLAEVTGHELPSERRAELATRFASLRPIVESGWEMAVLLGVLSEGAPADDAALGQVASWAAARDAYMRDHALQQSHVAAAFDAVRVRWIGADLPDWLGRHRFYPGVAEWLSRLAAADAPVYVLSTKGKPFLDALLAGHGVHLPSDRVIGKAEPRRDKWDVILGLAESHRVPPADVWFVEDRLATLLELRHRAPALAQGHLFLADWGYVFPDRDPAAARAVGIPVLTLQRMTGPFESWSSD